MKTIGTNVLLSSICVFFLASCASSPYTIKKQTIYGVGQDRQLKTDGVKACVELASLEVNEGMTVSEEDLAKAREVWDLPYDHPQIFTTKQIMASLMSLNERSDHHIIKEEDAKELAPYIAKAFQNATSEEIVCFYAEKKVTGGEKTKFFFQALVAAAGDGQAPQAYNSTIAQVYVKGGRINYEIFATADGYNATKPITFSTILP